MEWKWTEVGKKKVQTEFGAFLNFFLIQNCEFERNILPYIMNLKY